MSQSRRFRPLVTGPLDDRVLLDAAALASVAPVSVAPVDTSGRSFNLARAASDQVNVAFDNFSREYLQAQGAFFSLTDPNQIQAARPYFREYIVQRLGLLSQQLTRVFTQLPGALNRAPSGGGSPVLTSFLRTRISGTGPLSLSRSLAGVNLRTSPIPVVGLNGAAATLYTSQALAAIDATRTATLNAANFLLNHTFHNGHR